MCFGLFRRVLSDGGESSRFVKALPAATIGCRVRAVRWIRWIAILLIAAAATVGVLTWRKRNAVAWRNKPVMVSVRVGISDGARSEIVEGQVGAGDPLVTELVDGAAKPAGPPGGGAFRRGS